MSYEPEPLSGGGRAAAKSSVTAPAILLIIVGVLNILCGLYFAFVAFQVTRAGPQIQEQLTRDPMQQKNLQELEKQGYSMDSIMKGYSTGFLIIGALGALCGILMIVGGIKMMSLSGYGLSMTASILAMIPCTSPCCLLGLPFGIWSVVVLSRADVKAAFR
jgi:hypothetical protein